MINIKAGFGILGMTAAMALSTAVSAADRALLVGVGDHADPYMTYNGRRMSSRSLDLPGIDKDIEAMRQVADMMGFESDEVRVLFNSTATKSNIERGFRDWLSQAGPDDRVMFYFSGHGSQNPDTNGDEVDNADEVLLAHDVGLKAMGDRLILKNVIVDDDLNKMLTRLKSRNVTVLVDACQSGTSTKSINLRTFGGDVSTVTKTVNWNGMPSSSGDGFLNKSSSVQSGENYLALSAAQDDEYAQATSKGSMFTLGVWAGLKKSIQREKDVTWKQLHRSVTRYIEHSVRRSGMSESSLFRPNLTGSSRLANKPVIMRRASAEEGRVWQALEQAVSSDEVKRLSLSILPGRKNMTIDEDTFSVKVKLPQGSTGYYLNIVQVDANDQASVLYPNRWMNGADNRVRGDAIQVPAVSDGFEFIAAKPAGKTMVAAFLSREPINAYRNAVASMSADGSKAVVDSDIAELSPESLEGIKGAAVRARQKADSLYAASAVFNAVR